MRVLKTVILTALMALCFFYSFSQDKIYMGIGTQSGKITDINTDEIKFINAKGAPSQVNVKDVFLLFNGRGGYLVPYKMDFTNKRSKDVISIFLNPPPTTPRLADYIYTTDGKLIKGNIIKETKKSFTIGDNANKYDLDAKRIAAVIYKDGRHNLVSAVITAADVLWAVYEEDAKNDSKSNTGTVQTAPVKADPVKVDTNAVKTAPPAVNEIKKQEVVVQPKKDTEGKKPVPVPDSTSRATPPPAVHTTKFEEVITNVSREEFEKKAITKTNQLNEYLKVLCNKTSDYDERNKAVDLAVTLFINEDATVQTSSLNSDNRTTYKIKKYLQTIKLYNYDKVDIEWTKIQYVSNLKKGPDGNYYGTISFEQVFRGYIDGKVAYEDLTVKTGEVVLKAYQKMVNGGSTEEWDVLLGDISVKSTKSL